MEVERLSANHDQVFMSFNIEHWYPLLGPTKTAQTKFLPIVRPIALKLSFLNKMMKTRNWTRERISEYLHHDELLMVAANELDKLIPSGGVFIKTSARSCKDIALHIGLKDSYRKLLSDEIKSCGNQIDEMRLRILFMEAARQVLRVTSAKDFLIACAMSDRVLGVTIPVPGDAYSQDIERALKDDFKEPFNFVVRKWMDTCPPDFVSSISSALLTAGISMLREYGEAKRYQPIHSDHLLPGPSSTFFQHSPFVAEILHERNPRPTSAVI